jgi:hypothetical protein
MARTVEDHYNALIAAMNTEAALADLVPQADDAQTLLNDITSPSKVAEHRLWFWCFAYFSWLIEELFGIHLINVEARLAVKYGSLRWWRQALYDFQNGFALDFVEQVATYVDTTSAAAVAARIIKYAAAIQSNDGRVFLKAAKDNAGEPEPLSASEQTSVLEYITQKQPAGIRITFLSEEADFFMINCVVKYNPLVIAADGSLIAEPTIYPVEDAINEYLSSLPFNGVLSLTHLKDAVQAVEGVNDFIIDDAYYQLGITGWNLIDRLWQTYAGYIRVSTTAGETLSDTITYEAGE